MMRGVAQLFLKLIDKFPELEKAAFILIILIGVKMIAGAFGFEMPQFVFFGLLILIFVGTLVYSTIRRKKSDHSTSA
ncbi:TerC-like integral membrane protein [Paenibacillus pini JCM 16418]|uniref:TerC-like integral membrane protein n=1 Tax=Paenibacillus pini JCM 16418 TaxID=1236976 RepID=W7Z5A5_9BACL|nr:TerC-like integral membrane protein [Paenibacillus pini JCM 16418]